MKSEHCLPDPVISANIYCNRRLDHLIRDAITPFWRELTLSHPDQTPMIWFSRYAKCGEHLKLRVHSSEAIAAVARELLPKHLESFFDQPNSEPLPDIWLSKSATPALDAEDEAEQDYPNKSLLWTTYRRTPITLGCSLYVEDDEHVRRFAVCQSVVSQLMMEVITPALEQKNFLAFRQNQFFKLVLSGLAATDLDIKQWFDYQTYHRDWLLRFLVNTVAPTSTTEETILAEYEPRVARMAPAINTLATMIREASDRSSTSDTEPPQREGDWARAAGDFFDYVSTYRDRAEYDQDPYTRDHAFLPLFKVFHGAANQFGLRLSNEAYMHHVLCVAAEQALEASLQAHRATAGVGS